MPVFPLTRLKSASSACSTLLSALAQRIDLSGTVGRKSKVFRYRNETK
jgi:hypothetical protein